MSRPRLLDLFCGAGGAAMGYWSADDIAAMHALGIDVER